MYIIVSKDKKKVKDKKTNIPMTCCGGGALLYSLKNEKISIEKNDIETYRSTIMVDIYGWLWLWYAIIVILE